MAVENPLELVGFPYLFLDLIDVLDVFLDLLGLIGKGPSAQNVHSIFATNSVLVLIVVAPH